jgi:hypothetical protein
VDHTIAEPNLPMNAKPIAYKVTDTGCWECTSHRQRRGYALVSRGGKEHGVHRYVYELHHGKVPSTLVILHKCDNPTCINPDHLSAGTQSENMRDRISKGRGHIFGRSDC